MTGSLRDQIAEHLAAARPYLAFALGAEQLSQIADAVMTVVQPELDRQAAAFNAAIASTASDALEHRLCNMHLMGMVRRAEKAEAALAELNSAICWDTTCLNCASLLNASYGEYVRAEKAAEHLAAAHRLLAHQGTRIEQVVANMIEEQAGRQAAEAAVARVRERLPFLEGQILGIRTVYGHHALADTLQALLNALYAALDEPAQGEAPR